MSRRFHFEKKKKRDSFLGNKAYSLNAILSKRQEIFFLGDVVHKSGYRLHTTEL
jgi:hypothetical protein